MRSFIPWLFGVFVGWTCGAVYIALHEDRLCERVENECALRLRYEADCGAALSRLTSANCEIDRLRREMMRGKEQWWTPTPTPMAVVATGGGGGGDGDGERIPAPSIPYPTK